MGDPVRPTPADCEATLADARSIVDSVVNDEDMPGGFSPMRIARVAAEMSSADLLLFCADANFRLFRLAQDLVDVTEERDRLRDELASLREAINQWRGSMH